VSVTTSQTQAVSVTILYGINRYYSTECHMFIKKILTNVCQNTELAK